MDEKFLATESGANIDLPATKDLEWKAKPLVAESGAVASSTMEVDFTEALVNGDIDLAKLFELNKGRSKDEAKQALSEWVTNQATHPPTHQGSWARTIFGSL